MKTHYFYIMIFFFKFKECSRGKNTVGLKNEMNTSEEQNWNTNLVGDQG